ncbi:hypothetical protein AMAG_16644 [Allomyces macrogynus ATCC 38327]|uniref:HIT-type domain-containing protein n=1 Tax=Allomyces macrogynus (strain ATCC 38327) TaxID=578462 RepID=A0A0L0TBH3_ALLM3|nr:hypothetical protein AMAG_16644 [Allomyces macrogynus ATCC 38327]|eukprot:KNE72153.1 hypothetical protein AMAG_16644 [Allomyces macrogynus ATCC 38327]
MARGNVFSRPCAVCQAANAKYKCTTCLAPTCSLGCLRSHRDRPCAAPAPADQPDAAAAPSRPLGAFLPPKKPIPGLTKSKNHGDDDDNEANEESEEDEDEQQARIPMDKLMRLANTDAVLEALQSSRLRDVITRIDQANDDDPNKAAAREAMLLEALQADLEFAKLVDACLGVVRAP